MDTIVHDMESGIEQRWQWPHVGVGHVETAPFFCRQRIEDSEHLVGITFESPNRLISWQDAKCLGILIKLLTHHQQTKCTSWLIFACHIPARQVTLGYIYHVADNIAHFPFSAAGLNIPVFRIIHYIKEIGSLGAYNIDYSVFSTVVHRIDCHS